jgi:nucleotide-binding universal stress UspA family protein
MTLHTPPQVILAPVDYSLGSQRSLHLALDLANTFSARVVVMFAWAAPFAESPIASDELARAQRDLLGKVREETAHTMADFISQVKDRAPQVQLDWFIVSGHPPAKILDMAQEHHADLIVLGRHNRGAPARWFLGSVAEHVLRHATCPVLVIPTEHSDESDNQ